MSTVYLIDASPYIFRAYFSLPSSIKSSDGKPANAVYGYAEFLIQILTKAHPTHIAVAFDGSLTTSFRNQIYPEYKAHRDLPPAELEAQIDGCLQVTKAMGMATFIDDSYEADDLIGTFATQLVGEGHQTVVVSSDKDLTQLVNDRVTYWDFARDQRYDSEAVRAKFGVAPQQIVDLLALMGDAVDNIPGVKGVGRKTATALLSHFANIEDLYANIDSVAHLPIRGAASLKTALFEQKSSAFLSKKLAAIALDAPFIADMSTLEYVGPVENLIESLFRRLQFDRLKSRIPTASPGSGKMI
jgi:5'-3' exonuclease